MRTAGVWMAMVVVGLSAATAGAAAYTEEDFFAKPNPSYTIPTPSNGGPTTVIGEVRMYRIRPGDTLMDLARLFSLGYNEIVEANPGLDPWVPPVGATAILPTQWVLPCCSYSGLVVNIPRCGSSSIAAAPSRAPRRSSPIPSVSDATTGRRRPAPSK